MTTRKSIRYGSKCCHGVVVISYPPRPKERTDVGSPLSQRQRVMGRTMAILLPSHHHDTVVGWRIVPIGVGDRGGLVESGPKERRRKGNRRVVRGRRRRMQGIMCRLAALPLARRRKVRHRALYCIWKDRRRNGRGW